MLEEVIPLIAIYVPAMLPSTCILPSQRARIEEKRAEKALAFQATYAGVYAGLRDKASAGHMPLAALTVADAPTAVCGYVSLMLSCSFFFLLICLLASFSSYPNTLPAYFLPICLSSCFHSSPSIHSFFLMCMPLRAPEALAMPRLLSISPNSLFPSYPSFSFRTKC